jgi:ABC-type dipeptide/oligopeptide/nickel transport system permease subunit
MSDELPARSTTPRTDVIASPIPALLAQVQTATALAIPVEADEGGVSVLSDSRSAWRRFAAHRVALGCLVLLGVLLLLAACANLLPLQNPTDSGANLTPDAPMSAQHWLGTDGDGFDIFSRLIYGMRPTFAVGLIGQAITTILGLVLGLIAGYCRGWIDAVLARLADLLFALPTFLLAFLVVGVAGPQVAPLAGGAGQAILVTAVFAALGWPGLLRFVRSLVLSLREESYIEAARAMGMPGWQILRRHMLPATWGLVLVQASFGVGAYMSFEATLSVLGLGVQRPTPDLGLMVGEGFDQLFANTVEALAPSMLLTVIIVAFAFVGDGLRDTCDPLDRR